MAWDWQIPSVAHVHFGAGGLPHRRDYPRSNHLRISEHPFHPHRETMSFHVRCQLALAGAKAVIDGLDQGRFTRTGCAGEDIHFSQFQRKVAYPTTFADEKNV